MARFSTFLFTFSTFTLLRSHAQSTEKPSLAIPTYRVTTILHEPYLMTDPQATENSTNYVGIVKDILDRIGVILNVNFDLVHVQDNKFGHRLNGTGDWTGMIGELVRKEADIAAAALTVSAERAKSVQFSQAFATTGISVLLKKPKPHQPSPNSAILPFRPFTVGIWISIIVAYVVVSLALYGICRFNPEESLADSREHNITCCSAFFVTFNMFLLHGHQMTPSSHAGRTLLCFWRIFCLVTIVLYASSLTSILFLKSPDVDEPLPFYTFEQMVKQSKVQYGTTGYGSTRHYFKISSGIIEHQINEYWESHPEVLVSTLEAGVSKVKDGNGDYALVLESEFAYYTAARTCGLAVTGKTHAERSYAFACGPDSNICRKLDHALIEMKETGELLQITDKWMSGPCGRYVELSSPGRYVPPTADEYLDVQHMDTTRFTLPLVAMSCGVVISILVTGIEKRWARSKGITRGTRLPEAEDKQGFSDSNDIDL
ncbi:glutamate receptor U1-like [Argopecten irradians]|uniref:glutamate receptor U1-like n=1 Tax=Argopecten irradians TaxID=31199 RepID=UPI00371E89F4